MAICWRLLYRYCHTVEAFLTCTVTRKETWIHHMSQRESTRVWTVNIWHHQSKRSSKQTHQQGKCCWHFSGTHKDKSWNTIKRGAQQQAVYVTVGSSRIRWDQLFKWNMKQWWQNLLHCCMTMPFHTHKHTYPQCWHLPQLHFKNAAAYSVRFWSDPTILSCLWYTERSVSETKLFS